MAKNSPAHSQHGEISIGVLQVFSGCGGHRESSRHIHSSNKIYNKIWSLGACAVSMACFDAGSTQLPTSRQTRMDSSSQLFYSKDKQRPLHSCSIISGVQWSRMNQATQVLAGSM